MKILVQDTVVETLDIADVFDVNRDSQIMWNRRAGFVVLFLDNTRIEFGVNIPPETYPREVEEVKKLWKRRMDAVIEKWQSDKTDIVRVDW